MININTFSAEQPILIAGPTASGKSALALEIADRQGGRIVNADALQVYDGWRVLTARPMPEEEAAAPHALFGHVPFDAEYSTGHWLRDVLPLLADGLRPIIVGGTGLNFSALTEGLAEIPPTPTDIRAEADALEPAEMLATLDRHDPVIAARIDRQNPMRIQRAWEVLRATGRPLSDWQAETPAPALPLASAQPLLLDADRDWLAERIERRFDLMLAGGALEEARALEPDWHRAAGAAKAIGGPELIAVIRGEMSLDDAREAAIIGSRQYAKRQRTWFRARMRDWQAISLP
ncbi:tRNA (adenosine(37)-N6)-dimethylallyltransferase MiaA [Nioella aestuarii]|uniref:tRNA (adenosine(37)-N6)-dimethylallyltransferase MiaA n=1 Tax=Nioella aestuarii TaxID=1662864 RepID=UPI003D7FE241